MALHYDCFTIDRDVPDHQPHTLQETTTHGGTVAKPAGVSASAHALLTCLGVGDSIHATYYHRIHEGAPTPQTLRTAATAYKAEHNIRFSASSTPDGVRIWRIA